MVKMEDIKIKNIERVEGIDPERVGQAVTFFLSQLKGKVPEGTKMEFELYIDSVGKMKFEIPMPPSVQTLEAEEEAEI